MAFTSIESSVQSSCYEDPEDYPPAPLLENPFESESSRVLFDAIAALQSCDAGQDIDIPQLVIVGGQSTGKSSLLQSLVQIPFPTGQGCCTRFATRIISRRTAPGSCNECVITIVKPDFDLDEHFNYSPNRSYQSFRYEGETLNAQEFVDIMNEVSEKYMGITLGTQTGCKNFATEVLKIELSGPNRSHFSILDIPGVFNNAYAVLPSEMEGVKKMAIEYMKKPQNIVICVADAVTDLANQEVFSLAAKHVEKTRLIGVFTKCDHLVDPREVVSIATESRVSGQMRSMYHGWFVVRNRRGDDVGSDFDLAAAERHLFSTEPWARIPEPRRGSSMLRRFLGRILDSRIREEFPNLQKKVRNLLRVTQEEKKWLGDPRPTHQLRLQYLVDIVQKFNVAAVQALERPGHLPKEEMRVRGIVSAKNKKFDEDMRSKGHKFKFEMLELVKFPDSEDEVRNPSVNTTSSAQTALGEGETHRRAPNFVKPRATGQSNIPTPDTTPSPKAKIRRKDTGELREEIREQINIFQCNGLPGLLNTDVFPVLYKKQTQKWHDMAEHHIFEIGKDTKIAAEAILEDVYEYNDVSTDMREELRGIIQLFNEERLAEGQKNLEDYIEKEINFPLQTTNPMFEQRLQELRRIRFKNAALRQYASVIRSVIQNPESIPFKDGPFDLSSKWFLDSQTEILFREIHLSGSRKMEDEVHDVLKVYYELSLQSFIDYITKRLVEDLISSKKGALLGLSTDYILTLPEATVEKLAREDEDTVYRREQCDSRIARLEETYTIAEEAWQRTSPRRGEMAAV